MMYMSDFDWTDAAGKHPNPHGASWTWTDENLRMGEHVGFSLYLDLRDRLTTLHIPDGLHNQLIGRMIDMYDACLLDGGPAMVTSIMIDTGGASLVPMALLDGRDFPTRISENFGGFFEK